MQGLNALIMRSLADDYMSSAFPQEKSSFPLRNEYYNEETGEVVVDFALAGYDVDDINIEHFKDKFKITIDPSKNESVKQKDGLVCTLQNIKRAKFEGVYTLPYDNFNITEVTFKNGILRLRISPAESEKPKKIAITK